MKRLLVRQHMLLATIRLLVFLAVFFPGLAAAVDLSDLGQEPRPLGMHLRYLEDVRGTLTIEDLLRRDDLPWKASDSKAPNLGISLSPHWLTAELTGESGQDILLEIDRPPIASIQVFYVVNNHVVKFLESGAKIPFAQRPIAHRNFLFPLTMPSEQTLTLYVRVQARAIQIPMTAWSERAFIEADQTRLALQSLYAGIILVMLFYNLFLYFALRDTAYLWYVATAGLIGLFQVVMQGLAFQYLWPDSPSWNDIAPSIIMTVAPLCNNIFCIRLLDLRRHAPQGARFLFGLAYLHGVAALFPLLIPESLAAYHLSVLLVLISTVSTWVIAFVRWHRGHADAGYFTLALTAVVTGTLLVATSKYGFIPSNLFLDNALQIGSVLDVVLLSLALAQRINEERKEKHEAQRLALVNERLARQTQAEALAAQTEATENLEQRVQQRTAELVVAKERAEVANKAKSAFLSHMSHELRTPLNSILGFTRMILRQPLPHDTRHDLHVVLHSAEHLLTLINQVLDLSTIEVGRSALNETDTDLKSLLHQMESMFAPIAHSKSIEWMLECEPCLPSTIRTDKVKLQQVLINLIGNACKFTDKGRVTLRVDGKALDAQRWRLSFTVTDTGVGIAPEEANKLFSAFVQTESGRKAQQGTGLGLAISRSFVELMGSEIRVDSQIGRGSTFNFDITVNATNTARIAMQPQTNRHVTGLAPGQSDYRILIADDRAESRQLVVRLLGPLGFVVREAANGEESISIWQEWQPHLIFMDIHMPVLNGWEAAARIKSPAAGSGTIIVGMTARAFEEERMEVLAACCDSFIRKPFNEKTLLDALQTHLGVSFLYAEDDAVPATIPLDAIRLAALPVKLLTQLEFAVQTLSSGTVAKTIGEIHQYDAPLSEALQLLAADYDYTKMLTLIAAAKEHIREAPVDTNMPMNG